MALARLRNSVSLKSTPYNCPTSLPQWTFAVEIQPVLLVRVSRLGRSRTRAVTAPIGILFLLAKGRIDERLRGAVRNAPSAGAIVLFLAPTENLSRDCRLWRVSTRWTVGEEHRREVG